jgi:hypothetical protein
MYLIEIHQSFDQIQQYLNNQKIIKFSHQILLLQPLQVQHTFFQQTYLDLQVSQQQLKLLIQVHQRQNFVLGATAKPSR